MKAHLDASGVASPESDLRPDGERSTMPRVPPSRHQSRVRHALRDDFVAYRTDPPERQRCGEVKSQPDVLRRGRRTGGAHREVPRCDNLSPEPGAMPTDACASWLKPAMGTVSRVDRRFNEENTKRRRALTPAKSLRDGRARPPSRGLRDRVTYRLRGACGNGDVAVAEERG